ncbi:MAG: Hsp20/alpha crystallin family protein [Clostridium sp.]|nr:Hsp20/alpha crystallin family protein [Clostridium sp.]
MFGMIPFRKNDNVGNRSNGFGDLFDNFFDDSDDFFAPMVFNNGGNFKVDLKEDENSYTVEADLPGIKKEDISLGYENNYLTISAKRDETVENKDNGNYVRRERRCGEFKRSFYIDNIDENTVDAGFNNGVLKITLPKKDKGVQKKRIDIH